MLAYTAHVARTAREAGAYDVDAELRAVRWRAARDRIFARLDAERDEGRTGREQQDSVTVYDGRARFTGPRTLRIDREHGAVDVSAAQIVVAAGGRPLVPGPVTDAGLPYETSDTVMRIDAPPRHLAILGGGYIAAELADVFAETGSSVTVVEKEEHLFGPQDETVRTAYRRSRRTCCSSPWAASRTATGWTSKRPESPPTTTAE